MVRNILISDSNHVMDDLLPYMCPFPTCPMGDDTYSRRGDLAFHVVELHGVHKFQPCPFCYKVMSSDPYKHAGRHMEEIAFGILDKVYEQWSYMDSSSEISAGSGTRMDWFFSEEKTQSHHVSTGKVQGSEISSTKRRRSENMEERTATIMFLESMLKAIEVKMEAASEQSRILSKNQQNKSFSDALSEIEQAGQRRPLLRFRSKCQNHWRELSSFIDGVKAGRIDVLHVKAIEDRIRSFVACNKISGFKEIKEMYNEAWQKSFRHTPWLARSERKESAISTPPFTTEGSFVETNKMSDFKGFQSRRNSGRVKDIPKQIIIPETNYWTHDSHPASSVSSVNSCLRE